MKKLFYITRTWHPNSTGGSIMRQAQVKLLKDSGFDVVVVTPNYDKKDVSNQDGIIRTPYSFNKSHSIFQRLSLKECYLDSWADVSFKYLKDKIKGDDILFATSGGEIATFKLASLLGSISGAKVVLNYRDPISYANINGVQIDNKFHIDRSKIEAKYLKSASLAVTSSNFMKEHLLKKYGVNKNRVLNSYFGYIKRFDLIQKNRGSKINIAYMGSMSSTQSPEILSKSVALLGDDVKNKLNIEYIGNHKDYAPLHTYKNSHTTFSGPFAHDEFIEYALNSVDIGFVCLRNDYLGACIPSKIYEYINLALPILAALPKGDAKDIIEDNGFGICRHYDDERGIADAIYKMVEDNEFLNRCKKNIIAKREQWSMSNKMQDLIKAIKKL